MDKITFKYTAKDAAGMTVKGTIDADDQNAAIVALRSRYPVVMELVSQGVKGKGLNMEIGSGKIKTEKIMLLCSQFSIIISSGTPIVDAIRLIANQTKDKGLHEILEGVREDVSGGKSLAAAFEKRGGKKLPTTFYETIRAGENSGNLGRAFITLKEYYQKNSNLGKSIKSALIYPIMVIVVAIVVIIIVMVKLVPSLTSTFIELGTELPGITKLLVAMSDGVKNHLVLILSAIAAIIIGYIVLYKSKEGRMFIDRFKMKLLLTGNIQVTSLANQFSAILAMLVSSGLTMTRALQILAGTFENVAYREAVATVAKDVENGKSLGLSMRKHSVFPDTLKEMVMTGESTGELDNVLLTTAEYYANESENATKDFLAILNPILIVVIAIFVVFVVLAVYMPMFTMYDSM